MNVSVEQIVKIFESKIPRKVITVYDGGNRYLIASEDKSTSKFSNLDPYYTVKKDGKDIRGFNPMSEPDWYNKAIEKLVYGEEPEQKDPLDMIERMLKEIESEEE